MPVPNFISVILPRPCPFSGFLFLNIGEIVHMHPCAKFKVCSFTRVTEFNMGHMPFVDFLGLLSILEKLSICVCVPHFKSIAILVLEICLRSCQIL